MAKFSAKLSSLFTQKPFWTLGSFRKTLFTPEFIYQRESRRRNWKSWRWMRRLTAYFENTGLLLQSKVDSMQTEAMRYSIQNLKIPEIIIEFPHLELTSDARRFVPL